MKATGMVRKIDELGRIVLPKELRRVMDLPSYAPVEIFVDNDTIMLRRYDPSCTFCSNVDDLSTFKDKLVCSSCAGKLKELA